MSDLLGDVLRIATVGDIFRLAGLESPADIRKNIRCPFPDHNDATASFHIQPSNQGFKCFGCNREGGLLELALGLGAASNKREATTKLADLHGITQKAYTPSPKLKPRPSIKLLPPESELVFNEERHQQLRRALAGRISILTPAGQKGADYLRSRALPADAADANDVRYHLDWLGHGEAIIFAVRNQRGIIIAAQGRYLARNANPKARSIGDIASGVYATAGALESKVLAITEAPLDALSLALNQVPALALCGSSMKPWLRRHLRFRYVIFATDNDPAGNQAAQELRSHLSFSSCERFAFPDNIKDVNEWYCCDPKALFDAVLAARFRGLDTLLL